MAKTRRDANKAGWFVAIALVIIWLLAGRITGSF